MTLSGRARTALIAFAVAVASVGTCPVTQPVQHSLGSYFEHCRDDRPLLSHFFLLTDPAGVNSANVDAVCRVFPSLTSQFIPCQPEAGIPGDDQVTLEFDWGGVGPAFPGCPSPLRSVNGGARIHTHTVTADGTSILTSLSFSVDYSFYVVEMAQPWTGTVSVPIACDEPGRRLLRVDAATTSGGSQNVDLTVFAPTISTDCDPGSAGVSIGLCNGAAPIATITPGRVYLQRGSCAALPVPDLRTGAWTFLADSDTQGHASVTFATPANDECVYLGATYRFDDRESPAIAGFVKSPFAACADADEDGVTICDGDCDDANPRAYPGNTEVCDGIDNDCDGATDEGLGSVSCGKGRCATVIPACSGGVPQTCPRGRPVTPPCGHPLNEEPVTVPVTQVH